MDNALAVNPDLLANTDEVQKTLQEVNIEGAKTAYAYLVDFNGTMLYHPSAEKIGQPVENEAVKKMLKENTKRHDSKAGKGFAVVAAQIQKLAEPSNESAKRIDEIIHELLKDSENAVHTMEEVKEIMHEQNEKVQKTSEAFAKMQEGVGVSIRGMSVIDEQTKKIEDVRNKIVDTVQNLSAIAEENAASTEETSASMTEIDMVINDISKNAENLKKIAEVLDGSVKQFQME